METLYDAYHHPAPSMMKAVRMLIEHYQVYFVGDDVATMGPWMAEHVNVPAWHHTIYTYRRDLLYGDYLLSRQKEGDTMAAHLDFGSDTFKTWDDVITYFERLGGQ
jgi:hypothetical protein